jgi:hypothetical protein
MPADGVVQLGAVRLPGGRRICAGTPAAGFDDGSGIAWMAGQEAAARDCARAHPGVPLLWATGEAVPDAGRVWHQLHEMAPDTGLAPVILAFLGDGLTRPSARDQAGLRGRPWDSGELAGPFPVAGADEVDVTALLAEHWQNALGEDDPEWRAMFRPFSAEFPGLAPGSDGPLSGAELDAALGMMRPARLGLVPASRPSDVLALAGFTWFGSSYEGRPAELTAVLRSWEERFGAVLCQVGFADVRLLVTRPPRTRQAAELVAAEISVICDEFWPIERPGTALKAVAEIAGYVKDAPWWGLWWD